jgi:demethylmenaquinone methyltransferase/2-methoxy-6-polyprenyl-1,4-benzoquinol methylase
MPAPSVWNDSLLANPHAVADKRLRVRRMFAAIAPSYDLNNRLHSLWMDQWWRRRAVALADLRPTDQVVDVACGTGDLAMRFAGALGPAGKPVIGIDFTYEMLPIARQKSQSRPLVLLNGDALALPLPDASADVVSIAFGIRNVADPAAACREFRRILRPGGRLIILEFSLPVNPLLRGLYNFYFRKILPRTATWISGDKTGAYKYLPESVNTFIDRAAMASMMTGAGFTQVTQHPMTFGVCVCYRGLVAGQIAAKGAIGC